MADNFFRLDAIFFLASKARLRIYSIHRSRRGSPVIALSETRFMFARTAIQISCSNAQAGVGLIVCVQTNNQIQVGGLLINGTQLLGNGLQRDSR